MKNQFSESMTEFTIIVPVYNEEENLLRMEHALAEYCSTAPKFTSVLFVNDGSTDKSEKFIEEICLRQREFHFISFKNNLGLSAALKAGFDWVQTPLLGYIDSDLQTFPEDFNLLLEFAGEFDLITGYRKHRKDGIVKNVSSKIANSIRRIFTQDGIKDTGCPLKVLNTDIAKRIPMFKGMHRFLPALVLLQNGKLHQVPVRHFQRSGGKGKFGIWNRIFGSLTACFVYLWIKRNYIHYQIEKSA